MDKNNDLALWEIEDDLELFLALLNNIVCQK